MSIKYFVKFSIKRARLQSMALDCIKQRLCTKVLVGLYEEQEKPGNVIEFIKKSLGEPTDTDVEQLMAENEQLKRQKSELEKKIETL